MDELPSEIFHNIFTHLDLFERLKCTLVSRHWWNLLETQSLLYSVEIKRHEKLFDSFMNMIEQSPHRAAQVEELKLVDCVPTHFNTRTFCNIFLNLRIIHVKWHHALNKYNYFDQPIQVTRSNSKVTSLSDYTHCELASQMLVSNLCSRLETLELNCNNVYGSSSSTRTILDQLKNLPILTKLSLSKLFTSIHDLEVLHENIPSVQDFKLGPVDIKASEMACHIVPAASITSFGININDVNDLETHIQFYQYMAKKYTNIIHAEYLDDALNNYNSNDTKRVYSDGVVDFLKIIGPCISNLQLNKAPNDLDVFNVLDNARSQLKRLELHYCQSGTLLHYLARSNQAISIEKLYFHQTELNPRGILENMTSLTTLDLSLPQDIYHNYDPLAANLSLIVTGSPNTLKHLKITCSDILADPYTFSATNIETLAINTMYISKNIGTIVTNCFPKLVKLTLSGNVNEDVDLIILSPHFQAAFIHSGVASTHGFSFTYQDKTQYYLKTHQRFISVPAKEDIPTLSVVSLTEKQLIVHTYVEIVPC